MNNVPVYYIFIFLQRIMLCW